MKRLRPDFEAYKHVSYLASMRYSNGRICIAAIVIILFVGFFVNISIKRGVNNEKYSEMLDGCYHIYLDVGSNIGIQVRKLFEPERYPEGKVLPIFDKVFGNIDHRRKENHANGKRICVVGFEPNPRHKRDLKELEASYNTCGYKVKFFTETAVSSFNGKSTLFSDENWKMLEWSASLLSPDLSIKSVKSSNFTVKSINVIRLSDFIKYTVNKRKLPVNIDENDPPKVLMKMDIKGSEIDVIPDIIFTGALQYVNILMIEWHSHYIIQAHRKNAYLALENVTIALTEYSKLMHKEEGHFDFRLIGPHDESYGTERYPLPKC